MGDRGEREQRACWLCNGTGKVEVRADHEADVFHWTVRQQTNGIQLVLLGDLTERVRFGNFATGATVLGIDFRGVRHINTAGTLTLTRFLESLGGQVVEAIACSPAIVRQLTLLPMLRDRLYVASIMLPFECTKCDAEREIEVDAVYGPDHMEAPPLTCEECLAPMIAERSLADYAPFLAEPPEGSD